MTYPRFSDEVGPASVPAGRAPSGFIISFYTPDGVCVGERVFHTDNTVAQVDDAATRDAELFAAHDELLMVVYDGDSGARQPVNIIQAGAQAWVQ